MDPPYWREVIPLVAVLSSRDAKPLIEYLISACKKVRPRDYQKYGGKKERRTRDTQIPVHLANCIASEVPMNQKQLNEALIYIVKNQRIIEQMINRSRADSHLGIFTTIQKSKYGKNYKEIVQEGLFKNLDTKYIYEFSNAWIEILRVENEEVLKLDFILPLLKEKERQSQVTGALLMMQAIYNLREREVGKNKEVYSEAFRTLLQLIQTDDSLLIFSSVWAIAWGGYDAANLISQETAIEILKRLIDLWLRPINDDSSIKRAISWGIYSACIPGISIQAPEGLRETIDRHFDSPENDFDQCAAIHLAVITGVWTNEEIKRQLVQAQYLSHVSSRLSKFLQNSGFKKAKKHLSTVDSKK